MAVIYKYPLSFDAKTVVPDGQVLHFGYDAYGNLCAWISHPNDIGENKLALYIVGTGHQFDDNDISLLSCVDGKFVWHLIMDWQSVDV